MPNLFAPFDVLLLRLRHLIYPLFWTSMYFWHGFFASRQVHPGTCYHPSHLYSGLCAIRGRLWRVAVEMFLNMSLSLEIESSASQRPVLAFWLPSWLLMSYVDCYFHTFRWHNQPNLGISSLALPTLLSPVFASMVSASLFILLDINVLL